MKEYLMKVGMSPTPKFCHQNMSPTPYYNNFSVKKEGLHLREMAKMPSDVKQLDSEIDDVKRNWFKLTQLSSSFKNELENSLGSYFRSQMDYLHFRWMISRLSFSFVW